jgi:hypothetical protein
MVLKFLQSVRGRFTDDVSETIVGLIFTGREQEYYDIHGESLKSRLDQKLLCSRL